MIKKVKVEQLRPGMFVSDFNCGWLENPFFHNSLKLTNESMVQKVIKQGIREVYIDTSQGLDVKEAKTEAEVEKEIREKMTRVEPPKREVEIKNIVPMREELHTAKKVRKEAKKLVDNIMTDIKMGKQVELEKVDKVVTQMVDSVFRNKDALTSLSKIKKADEYTFHHSVNVCVLLVAFARNLGMDRETVTKIGSGALLHDIGKMKVPQMVLNKPGKLTDAEFATMKSHVTEGENILLQTPGIEQISIQVAAQHHERYDGTGYPRGLKGNDISRYGQMASIVDVYDALTSDRVYHKGMDSVTALRKLLEWSKFHFEAELVQHYIKAVGIYPVGTLVRLESGLLAVVSEPGQESLLTPKLKVIYNTKKDYFVTPYELDLSAPNATDRILDREPAEQWNINPLKYIDIEI